MILPEKTSQYHGFLLVIFSAVLFGTTGTSQALAPEGISATAIGSLRLVIGGPVLLLLTLLFGGTRPVSFRPPLVPTVVAACGIVMFQLCFFEAVARTGVALGTIVAICVAPVISGLLSAVFQKERLTRTWMAASVLAISGCVLLTLAGGDVRVDTTGIFLAFGAGFGYAVSLVASKAVVADHSPVLGIAVILCVGAVLVLPRLLTEDLSLVMTGHGMAVVLYLGLVATAAAYLLLAKGLSVVPVSRTALLMLVEPLTGCLLGVLLLGEIFTPISGAGALLIFSGLVVISLAGEKPPPVAPLVTHHRKKWFKGRRQAP
ncbi:MAG TPA: EamA family transporter [Desulfotignum sp.]|jgi:drug/metabolite transporter, DME family|nr:EamA family transporter [Desulfotignum sp.]